MPTGADTQRVQAIGRRTTCRPQATGAELRIRPRRTVRALLFLPLWLVGLAWVGFGVLRGVFADRQLALVPWLIFWAVVTPFLVFVSWWLAIGGEVVTV